MDDVLFRRIITEAGRYPQVACINLFLMNEPLTDGHLVERIQLAKHHNPQAQISLWSNGVALDPPLTRRLLASPLSSIGFSLHAHRPETYRRITGRGDFHRILRNVVAFVEQRNARRPDLAVVLRFVGAAGAMEEGEPEELVAFWRHGNVLLDIDEGYLSRAGALDAPGAIQQPHQRMAGCSALGGPKQAHVLFTGQVVLCCMDYKRVTCLGDCNEQTLAEIWSGPRRRETLERLYGGRPVDPETFLCCRCELALPASGASLPEEEERDAALGLPADGIWAAV
jgi:hypothetical protein